MRSGGFTLAANPSLSRCRVQIQETGLLRARIRAGLYIFSRAFHLRRRQAVGGIGALAQQDARIELAARGIFQHAILHAVVRIAGIEDRLLDHRKLGGGNEAGLILVDGLRDPYRLQGAAGIVGGRPGDHAVKVGPITAARLPNLGGHQWNSRSKRKTLALLE